MNIIYPILCSVYIFFIYPILFFKGVEKNKSLALFFLLTPILITMASQVNIGTDYPSYIALYKGDIEFKITNSVFFYYLFHVLNLITDDPRLFFVVVSVLQFILFWSIFSSFMEVFSRKEFFIVFMLAFFCLTFLSGFNILRSHVASLVLIYSFINHVLYRKWGKYILFVLIGALFHPTVLIFILFPFLVFIFDRKIPFGIFSLIILFFFILGQINFVGELAKWLYNTLPPNVPYKFYLVSEHMNSYIGGMKLGMFVNLIICLIASFFMTREVDDRLRLFCNLGIVTYLLGMLFYTSPIFNRVLYYLAFFQAFLLAYLTLKMINVRRIYTGLLPIIYAVLYFYFSYYSVQQFNGNI